jgi:N-acetylglucosamine-6-sulfatase
VQNSSGIHRRLLPWWRCTTLGGADHPALPKGGGAYVERHAKQGDVGRERRSCAVRAGVRHENRAESLQAVDDLVSGVVGELSKEGVLDNTYIFFTSDNGFHEGEHRLKSGKSRPYEEDIRMPLLVRGPGVAAGHQAYELALNTDYLPTFTDFACSPDPIVCETLKTQNNWYVPDGRSLRPVLEGSATTWRNAILLEGAQNTVFVPKSPAYRGIRTVIPGTTSGSKYVEYEGKERELYDLGADPLELTNRYAATAPPAELVSRLQTLKTCKGDLCRAAEDGQ